MSGRMGHAQHKQKLHKTQKMNKKTKCGTREHKKQDDIEMMDMKHEICTCGLVRVKIALAHAKKLSELNENTALFSNEFDKYKASEKESSCLTSRVIGHAS